MIFAGRSYSSFRDHRTSPRLNATRNIHPVTDKIWPMDFGNDSNFMFMIRECLDYLEVRATARVSGIGVNLNLLSIMVASVGLQEIEPYIHEYCPSESCCNDDVLTTSIISPSAGRKKIAIALTQNNPTVWFFCCETGVGSFLLNDCYLDYAIEQVREFGDSRASRVILV